MNIPLLSIIVPSYNQAEFIENTILSVIGQTFQNWELIIQDGNSQDKTKEICEIYTRIDNRVSFFSEPDGGFADAVNKGIKKCKGTICAIQSSDDFYAHKNVFEEATNFFKINPELVIVSGSCQHITPDYVVKKNEFYYLKNIEPIDLFLLKSQFAQGSTFFMKSRAIQIGYLDINVDMVADTDFWIRMGNNSPVLKKENIYQCDNIWSYAMIHPMQRNTNQVPFYFGRAKMSVSHFYNDTIKIEKQNKKNFALNLINDAFELYCSMGLNCDELTKLYFKLTQNKISLKKRLKITLSKNNVLRKFISYHFSNNEVKLIQQNIHLNPWVRNNFVFPNKNYK